MMKQRRWFTVPILLLVVGILVALGVLYMLVTKNNPPKTNTNGSLSNVNLQPVCGNGVCENEPCKSANCPPVETSTTCPADCTTLGTGGNDVSPGTNGNENNNQNVNGTSSATLSYKMGAQTIEQLRYCPIEEANMAPVDAVAVAARNSLSQGTSDLTVTLEMSDKPLDQCIWVVRNATADGRQHFVSVIDATQEVYQQGLWTK